MANTHFDVPIAFDHIGLEQGLVNVHVTCLYQDRLGYIWIGTNDGLNRYDGFKMITYQHRIGDSNSLDCNAVTCICEDDKGQLWIGTPLSINMLDRVSGSFHNFAVLGTQAISQDSHGTLWAGTYTHGLYTYHPASQTWNTFRPTASDGEPPEQDYIYKMLATGDTLWVASLNHGLKVLNLATGTYLPVSQTMPNASLLRTPIQGICLGQGHVLWLATLYDGLLKFDFSSLQIQSVHVSSDYSFRQSRDRLSAVIEDKMGYLWIGHQDKGLDRFNPRTGQVQHFQHNSQDKTSLADNSILCLYCDNSGIIWLGCKYEGIQKIDYSTIRFMDGHSFGLPKDKRIWSFCPATISRIWIGADDGACLVDSRAGHVLRAVQTNYPVRAMAPGPDSIIWLATLGDGLYCLNKGAENARKLAAIDSISASKMCPYLYCLEMEGEGALWLGSHGGGLYRYEPVKKKLTSFSFSNCLDDPKADHWCLCILDDRQQGLWLGVWEYGLLHFDKKAGRFSVLANDIPVLRHTTVLSLHLTKTGILWAGTQGKGLFRIDPAGGDSYRIYGDGDGLPSNVVYGIVEDTAGCLWLTTNKGLCSFNPARETFSTFGPEDGLLNQEFNLGALFHAPNGIIYAGGGKGFNYFYPLFLRNTSAPRIFFTSVRVNGRETYPATTALKPLRLQHTESQITFAFAGVHYSRKTGLRYAYRLCGLQDQWSVIDHLEEITYIGLQPGVYTFSVKAANSDGIWSEAITSVSILIHPPLWKRWEFIVLTLVAISFILWQSYRLHAGKILKMERARVQERDRMREKIAADFHDQLGHRLTKISMLSKRLLQENNILQAHTRLQKIADNADSSIDEMRQLVWELDPQKDRLIDLLTLLKNYSDRLFDDTALSFRIDGLVKELEDIQLTMDVRRELACIFKEGMHNIVKHAPDSRQVRLAVYIQSGTLRLTLSDDGPGFCVQTCPQGDGLKNMLERSQKIGATLDIDSDAEGTRLSVGIKLT